MTNSQTEFFTYYSLLWVSLRLAPINTTLHNLRDRLVDDIDNNNNMCTYHNYIRKN